MAFQIPKPATAFSLDPSDKKQKRMIDEAHLAFIRKLPSVLSGKGPCEACHIRYGDPVRRKKHTGMGQKPDDAYVLPLLPSEHRAQHNMNEQEFWRAHGVDDPIGLALLLYGLSGNQPAAEGMILAEIRMRNNGQKNQ